MGTSHRRLDIPGDEVEDRLQVVDQVVVRAPDDRDDPWLMVAEGEPPVVHEVVVKRDENEAVLAAMARNQQGRQDSNLQPPVLETGALPVELRP
jgi:hypothetical protein